MVSVTAPKHEHTFRQSFLNQWFLCPESARRQHLGLMPPEVNNSNLVRGNAVHAAIEWFGNEWGESNNPPALDDLLDYGDNEFELFGAGDGTVWFRDSELVRDTVRGNLEAWHTEALPALACPSAVEEHFNKVLWVDNDRLIRLSGTCDWVQDDWLVDWKNPSRSPRKQDMWLPKRSNLQSHVYSWALGVPNFSLCHLSAPNVEWNHMVRGASDYDALIDLCLSIAIQIEANLPSAVKQWDSWYCSPKWCGAWDTCRGKFLGDNPF